MIRRVLIVCSLLAAACSAPSKAPPGSTPFGPASAASPSGAVDVTPGEFDALLSNPDLELTWLNASSMEAAVQAEVQREEAELAFLAGAAAGNPFLAERLARKIVPPPDATVSPSGELTLSVGEATATPERVVLHGDRWRKRWLAETAHALGSRAESLKAYRAAWERLAEDLRADLPAPDAVTDAELSGALETAGQRVADSVPNEASDLDLNSLGFVGQATGCEHATELSAITDFNFVLKPSLSAIRHQGNRGTCVAHAIAGALEARVKFQFGRTTNLSEQQLYAKAKGDWYPTAGDFGDGLPNMGVLEHLIDEGLNLRTEAAWSYNRSPKRLDVPGYPLSCDGYGEACSNTNHQFGQTCTTVGNTKYCVRFNPTKSGASAAEHYRLESANSASLSMTSLRIYALIGQPVTIGVDVFDCLREATQWVGTGENRHSDGKKAFLSLASCGAPGELRGMHAMLLVGWVSASQLAAQGYTGMALDEGGYFIVRNSWGCGWGDGGYGYLSEQYLASILNSAQSVGSVDGAWPRVTLTASKAWVSQDGTVKLTATANSLVKRVSFHRQTGNPLTPAVGEATAAPFTATFSLSSADNGDQTYYARGYDADGNVVSSNTVKVKVRIPGPPRVTLSAVKAQGKITLTATAFDDGQVVRVEFWRESTKLAEDTAAPYTHEVPLTVNEAGDYIFRARAWDNLGNEGVSNVEIVTVNAPPPPMINSFTATPSSVSPGATVHLAWDTSFAGSLSLTPPGVSLTTETSRDVVVNSTTTFTLVAQNYSGSVQRQVTVTVNGGFSPMATCDAATTLIDNSGNDFSSRVYLASAPGSPTTLLYAQGVSGMSGQGCRARTVSQGTWSADTPLSAACAPNAWTHVASGGGVGLVAWSDSPAGTSGRRKRTTGAAFTDVGTALDDVDPENTRVLVGPGGHGLQIWHSNTGIGTALISPDGTTFTVLPENAFAGYVPAMGAVLDASGDGFALWLDGNANLLYARAFRSRAWAGQAVSLAAGGTLGGALDVALLPGGDAYVGWNNSSGALNVRGATLHYDSALNQIRWGTPDELATGLDFRVRVLAAANGDLTVLWVANDGNGNFTLHARRRLSGAFTAAVSLGAHFATYVPAVIDSNGHVTVAVNPGDGTIQHRRVERGSSTWQAAVRVDRPSGTGTAGAYDLAVAVDSLSGHLLFAWVAANDLIVTECR